VYVFAAKNGVYDDCWLLDTTWHAGSARKLLQGSSAATPQQTVKSKCTTTMTSDPVKAGMAAAATKTAATKPGVAATTTTPAANTVKPAAATQPAGTTARPASKPATPGRASAAQTYRPLVVMGPTPKTEERFKIGGEDARGLGK
jgi:hypothetical protein